MALSLVLLTSWMPRSIRTLVQMWFRFLFFAQNKIIKVIIILPIPVPREKELTNSTISGSDLEGGMQGQHSVKPRN